MTDSLAKIDQFLNASMSDATRRAYRSDWNAFLSFCGYRSLQSLPASELTISTYLSELANSGKSNSTIVRSLTAINKAHELAGHGTIRTPAVKQLLRGIRRTIGRPQTKVRAISYDEIVKMASFCDSTLIGTRDRAILMLGWTSALRRSELVALNFGDLQISEQGIIITIRRSKSDQEGQGTQIAIPRGTDVCPVDAVERWMHRLTPAQKTDDQAIFRSIGIAGRKLWATSLQGRLSGRMISNIVKRYAQLAGLPPNKYASHSLRRGLATEAGARRIPERIIARHTRHASMATLREYIEAGNIWIDNPLTGIYPCVGACTQKK